MMSLLLPLLILMSCAKTTTSVDPPTVNPLSNTVSGIFFLTYKQLNRFVPDSSSEKILDTSAENRGLLGMNGNYFTDFDEKNFGRSYEIHVRQFADSGIHSVRTLTLSDRQNYFIRGPIHPSLDGELLIVPMSLFSEGVSSRTNGYNVVGALNNIVFSVSEALDPTWISGTEIISAHKDEIHLHSLGSPDAFVRIGPLGLGAPGTDVSQLAVSPDRKRIAFVQNESIWVIQRDGTGLKQLTTASLGLNWPTWSPDGRQIIVVSSQCPGLGSELISPEVVTISSFVGNQNLVEAPRLLQSNGQPFRACGPLYWK